MRVAILGGGLTGLTTGLRLARKGASAHLFESSSSAGGLAATFRSHGFAFDFGPHEFCTENQALIDLVEELLGPELLTIERRTAQYFRGHLLRYPFELADILRKVEFGVGLLALTDVMRARIASAFLRGEERDFESWTKARFGTTLFDLYFGPYTRKVWGRDPSQIDARTAAARITAESAWDLTRKTLGYHILRREDLENIHSEHRRTFRYARGGIGTLQDRLREAFLAHGGTIHYGKRVVGMGLRQNSIASVEFQDGQTFRDFDSVVSSVPLTELVPMALGPRGAALVRERNLPYRGMAFVFLRLARPMATQFHWVYYPDAEIPFQRVTEFSHFEADMAPLGSTGLALEIACDPGDEVWKTSDATLGAVCVRSLTRMGQMQERDVLGFDVIRSSHAYPVQVVGFRESADELLTALREIENLSPVGRQGLFRYCNMNECMEMAFDVSEALLQGHDAAHIDRVTTWEGVHKLPSVLLRQGA